MWCVANQGAQNSLTASSCEQGSHHNWCRTDNAFDPEAVDHCDKIGDPLVLATRWEFVVRPVLWVNCYHPGHFALSCMNGFEKWGGGPSRISCKNGTSSCFRGKENTRRWGIMKFLLCSSFCREGTPWPGGERRQTRVRVHSRNATWRLPGNQKGLGIFPSNI